MEEKTTIRKFEWERFLITVWVPPIGTGVCVT